MFTHAWTRFACTLGTTTALWLSGCTDPAPTPSPDLSPTSTFPVEATGTQVPTTPTLTAPPFTELPESPTLQPTAPPGTRTPGPDGTQTPTASPNVTPTPEATTPVGPTQTPSGPTPSVTPTVTPTVTPSVTPTVTPSVTPSETPSVTPPTTPSVTPDGTSTPPSLTPVPDPDQDDDGFPALDASGAPLDCLDTDATVYPGASEVPYDGIDQDCDGLDLIDQDEDGWEGGPDGLDCDDLDPLSAPNAVEVPYDGIDQDCDGMDLTDQDEDGWEGGSDGLDCNDLDDALYPSAPELPYDGIDQDCSGADLIDVDADGHDASSMGGDDCNDTQASIHPGAPEVPYDGIDQDCTGGDLDDVDGDGYRSVRVGGPDCQDENPAIHPGASEVCDGIDNNCDTQVDEGQLLSFYADADDDGFGDPDVQTLACNAPSGSVEDDTDCDDTSDSIYPGAAETCNDLDDNCDDQVDEGVRLTFYRDSDQDGFGSSSSTASACTPPSGYSSIGGDCNDANPAIHPSAQEVCDPTNTDEDCDSRADDNDASVLEASKSTFYLDEDGDGYGAASWLACDLSPGLASSAGDCNDADATIKPGVSEVAGDSIDQNCDGQESCFKDADDDGYRPDSTSTTASGDTDCADVAEAKASDPTGDCADNNPAIHPGQAELPDGIDQNCSGQADEGAAHASCKSLKQYLPGTPSGLYTIDPDGVSGALASLEVYCDMVTDGGGWTVIPPSKIGTYATIMSSFQTDKTKVIFYILRSDGAQFHTIAQQLAAFSQYPVSVTETADRLTVTFIPRNVANVSGMTQGFRSNGTDLTFSNCDGNPNSYLEFWRAGSSYSWTQDYNMSMRWRDTKQGTTASLPSAFYGFTAIHFGGCGTHSTSPAWAAYDGATAAALGVR